MLRVNQRPALTAASLRWCDNDGPRATLTAAGRRRRLRGHAALGFTLPRECCREDQTRVRVRGMLLCK